VLRQGFYLFEVDLRFDDLARRAADSFVTVDSGADTVRANLATATSLGLPALTVPTDLGGLGANLYEFASYQQVLARADGSTALVLAMHHMLVGGETEGGAWPAGPWRELCAAAVGGGALVNSAATEPGAGTPSQAGLPSTTAAPLGAHPAQLAGSRWRLNGRKAYTTGAPFLTFMRVSARVEPPGAEPFGARFLVRLPAAGVRVEDAWRPAALREAANDDVVLEAVEAEFLYREERRGCEGTVWFQVAIAATYLGIGYAAYQAVVDFSRSRVTAAGPVTDRESVRLRLGRARAALDVGRRNLLATCREWVETPRDGREGLLLDVGLAKVTAVNAAAFAAEEAVRLAGAGGFGDGHPFARLLLESRAGLSHPPIDDAAHLRLAERDLG
jgi:alkylation response protein AidB-like acyl-CoA dehydrogenase